MILSRRQAHFYVAIFLSCTLPVVFLAGLLWRPSTPTVDDATDELFAAANFSSRGDTTEVITPGTLSVKGISILAEVAQSSEGEMFLDLQPAQALQFSDVLVYWVPGNLALESVDEEAILLGQLSGISRRRFSVPAQIKGKSGQLLFYSRGQDEAISSVPLPSDLFP